jgi:hypothetical protein
MNGLKMWLRYWQFMEQAEPGSLSRIPTGNSSLISIHTKKTKSSRRASFANLLKKLSDGVDEKLMHIINIVGAIAPDAGREVTWGEVSHCCSSSS